MSNIIEVIKSAPDYIGGIGIADTEIENAEKQLGVKFALDYKYYLKEIGLACFDGHELTGICKSSRLNVVDVTMAQREKHPETCSWYVIEEANIDGMIIWQDTNGSIYQTGPGVMINKIYDTLADYVK